MEHELTGPKPEVRWPKARAVLLVWGVAAAFWTLMGFVYAAQLHPGFPDHLPRTHFWEMVGWQFASGYLWAFLTPGVLLIARRLPLARPWRALALHLLASAVVVSLHLGLLAAANYAIDAWLLPPAGASLAKHAAIVVNLSVHVDAVLYWAILGVGYALTYYGKLRERDLQTSKLETRLATAELQALKLQLNPHLLFNTLHTVGALIRGGEPKAALKMLAGLSDLLRYTLQDDRRQEVPLAREMRFVERYLEIQKIRFSDRLEVELDVASETLVALVPSLVLQPLVENALRYGIGTAGARGLLRLSAACRHDELEIRVLDRVLDNGSSDPAAAMASATEPRHGLGLANTAARLELLYGAGRRLELRQTGEGTVAELRIPWRVAGEETP